MDVVRRADLEPLALRGHGPCVSLFLPTHRAGRETEQAPIRLKNLLRQATEALQVDGVRAPEIERLLAPLRRLLDDRLEEVDLPGVPLGVRGILQGEEVERQVQPYVADRGGVGARGIFHGHGDASDAQAERILQYFRKVDRRLREVLAGERAPMVLAAVEHLSPLWRKANTYPHLVDQTLPGNPESLRHDQLHTQDLAHGRAVVPASPARGGRAVRPAGRRRPDLPGPPRDHGGRRRRRIEILFVFQHPRARTARAALRRPATGDSAPCDVLELVTVTALSKDLRTRPGGDGHRPRPGSR